MSALLCIWVLNAIDELHLNSYAEQLFHSSNYKHGNISFLMKITFNNDNHAIKLDINSKTLAKGCLNWTLNAHFFTCTSSLKQHRVSDVVYKSIKCIDVRVRIGWRLFNFDIYPFSLLKNTLDLNTMIRNWVSLSFIIHLCYMCSFCNRIFFFNLICVHTI